MRNVNTSVGTGDVRLLAQQAMQDMSEAHEEDLRGVIDEIETNAAAKAEIRELERLLQQFEDATTKYYESDPQTAEDLQAMKDGLAELRAAIKDAGYGENSELFKATISPDAENGEIGTGTFQGIYDSRESYFGNLESLLEGESERLGDFGDQLQIKMQMSMSALNTCDKTKSDILKAFSDNLNNIAANIKP